MIAIVDYPAGNLPSVLRTVQHLGHECRITADPDELRRAEKVIFPGVAAAGSTMRHLRTSGIGQVLTDDVFRQGKPLLAICIGIQIIFEKSEEDSADCLAILAGSVKRFPGGELKVPQIGWNQVRQCRSHPIFKGVPDAADFYFVNSYYPAPADPRLVMGTTEYGIEFASVVAKDNLVATQFHLEKSGPVGLKMLDNFCNWM